MTLLLPAALALAGGWADDEVLFSPRRELSGAARFDFSPQGSMLHNRSRPVRLALFGAATFLVASSLAFSAEPVDSPQQKVLNQFLGDWQASYKVPKSERTPRETSGTAELSAIRAVGGRFIQEKSEHSDSTSGSAIITYDEQRKCYRSWWFSSKGQVCESTGQWDGQSRTMTWTSSQENMTSTTRHRFMDSDNAEWSVSMKDARGKVFFRMEGTNVRRPAEQ